jgi:ferrous iron transport protein B
MSKGFTIALAGSPNSGKTTIFNSITGSRQHVGNYPGVTVEQKSGVKKYKDYLIKLVDLPGTYSLTAYSMEEIVSRDYIINSNPEIILNVVDSSSLERNLYLTTQLIELDVPLVIAFNMSDILMKIKEKVNIELLSSLLGAPIVQTVGNKSKGIEELLDQAVHIFEKIPERKKVIINYGEEIENEISKIENLLKSNNDLLKKFNLRWLAIKLLEQDREVISHLKSTLDDLFIV